LPIEEEAMLKHVLFAMAKVKSKKKMRAIPLVVQKRLLAMDVLAEDGLQLGIKGVIKEVQ